MYLKYLNYKIRHTVLRCVLLNMLVHTLYSNDVDNSECCDIIKLFKEKVLENVVI